MISSFSFLYLRSCAGDSDLVLELVGDVLLLQAPQLLVVVGDLVEGFDHLRLQLGLDRGERHLVFELVVVVHVGFGGGFRGILLAFRVAGSGLRSGTASATAARREARAAAGIAPPLPLA